MDKLIKAYSEKVHIRFSLVDVTMTAKALEGRHLCGPTSAMALAEGLVAVALLSQDAAADDEAVMLRMNLSGPLGGMMVEACGDGGLRGFTNIKIINELDGLDKIDTAVAFGDSGAVLIQTSLPGKILNQASLNVNPPEMKFVLGRYFNQSMQVPTACEVCVRCDSGGIISARGMLAQRMADSDSEAFLRVLERFEDKSVHKQLEKNTDFDALGKIFEIDDITERETRELMFKCRCSRESSLAVLKTLERDELEKMIEAGGQNITCHMCGNTYHAAADDIRAIIAGQNADENNTGEADL